MIRHMSSLGCLALALGLCSALSGSDPEATLPRMDRRVPSPLPDHPGNIYLLGEPVFIRVGAEIPEAAVKWTVLNAERKPVATGDLVAAGKRLDVIAAGALPVGWYRAEFIRADGQPAGWTSAAVLQPLTEPTPFDSPICLDTAMAWFARDDAAEQARHANLAALAGVNWVRDRIAWREMEPERGVYAGHPNNYDHVAQDSGGRGPPRPAGLPRFTCVGGRQAAGWRTYATPFSPRPARHVPLLPRNGPAIPGPGPGLGTMERS